MSDFATSYVDESERYFVSPFPFFFFISPSFLPACETDSDSPRWSNVRARAAFINMHVDITRGRARRVVLVLIVGDRYISRKCGRRRRTMNVANIVYLTDYSGRPVQSVPRRWILFFRAPSVAAGFPARRTSCSLDPTPALPCDLLCRARSRRLDDYTAFPCAGISSRHERP